MRNALFSFVVLSFSLTCFGQTHKFPLPESQETDSNGQLIRWRLSQGVYQTDTGDSHMSGKQDENALDITLPSDSDAEYPVLASAAGIPIKVECSINKSGQLTGYGCHVELWHDNNGNCIQDDGDTMTRYGHMTTLVVKAISQSSPTCSQQTIPQGGQLGLLGETGFGYGDGHPFHLHYQLHQWDNQTHKFSMKLPPPPFPGTNGSTYSGNDYLCDDDPDGANCASTGSPLRFVSNNAVVNFVPVASTTANPSTGLEHGITTKSHLIAEAHRRSSVMTNNLTLFPTDDTNHPNSRFLHCWLKSDQSCSGFWIQNHHDANREKRGANVYHEGSISAHTIRAGFWDVFSNFGGPDEVNGFGYPFSDEVPDKPDPNDTGAWDVNCSNDNGDTCPAIQYFYKNSRQAALVYNPNWPSGNYPLGVVRLCPSSTCAWQPNVDPSTFTIAPVYMAGAWSGNGTGGGSSNLTLKPSYISYDRVDFDVTNTGGLALDDLALLKDGQQVALFAPGAISTPTTSGLNSGTTYTFQLQGLIDDWGSVIESDTVQITTLPAPSTTLKLVSGITAVNEQYPDAFHLGSCITVTYQIENTGTSSIAIEQLRAEAEIQDGPYTYTRDFDHVTGTPLVNLAPGARYTYTGDNCDDRFPDDYHPSLDGSPVLTGRIRPRMKVHTVADLWDITDIAEGAKWLDFKLYDTFNLPELHQTGIRVSPERLQSNLWTAIDFDVTNSGSVASQRMELEVVIDGVQTYTRNFGIIPAYTTVSDGIQPGFLSEGVHHVSYRVDYLDYTPETDESNNNGSFFITVGFPDYDDDGIQDSTDNCRYTANPDQLDTDSDNKGNACDSCPTDPANDADMDGYCANLDNCPTVTNFYQENADGDAFGNACDSCPTDPTNTCLYLAEYFNNVDLTGTPVLTLNETAVDHNWDLSSPDPSINPELFSARYTRTTYFAAGTYQFYLSSDDGSRLYIDDQLVINDWWDHAIQDFTATRYLTAGNHTIRVEYYERGGGAILHFNYTYLGNEGWSAKYWNTPTAGSSPPMPTGTPTLTRVDNAIYFDWGGGSPGSPITIDKFIVEWERQRFFTGGLYRFYTACDDGVRLYLDGTPIVNKWVDQGETLWYADVNVSAGTHTLKAQYYENGGGAVAKVYWVPLFETAPFVGEYFTNRYLTGSPAMTRNDATINFDWGGGGPGSPIPVDNFSVRWTKTLSFDAGTYQFRVTADDGVRLYIDNQLVIDKWIDQGSTTYTVNKTLTSGNHTIRMEYYENGGGAVAKFSYRTLN